MLQRWRAGRRPLMVLLVAMVLMVVGGPASAGGGSGQVTVSGSTVATVRLGSTDILAEMRTHLADDGDSRRSSGVVTLVQEGPGTGTCYALSGEVVVSSNVAYDLLALGNDVDHGLRLMLDTPADFATCVRGEPVTSAMFASSEPPGAWVLRQPRTARHVHPLTLGLIVGPGDDPLAILADASFTILAQPAG